MNTKSPIFTLHEPHHFTDYGFDSQIDYFQVLEEARKHKRETSSSRSAIDNLHFKLQKPISKDKIKKTKRWWKNAIHFFKRKRTSTSTSSSDSNYPPSSNGRHYVYGNSGVRTVSGPVYLAEPSSYHRRSTSRPSSGPLAGTITPVRKGDLDIPYISLTEVNVDETHKISVSPMPIYLVT